MQMEDYILAVFTNFFRVLIIWRFMNLFFVPRVKQGKESVAYIVYLIIILTIFFVFQYPLFNLLSNWLGFRGDAMLMQYKEIACGGCVTTE